MQIQSSLIKSYKKGKSERVTNCKNQKKILIDQDERVKFATKSFSLNSLKLFAQIKFKKKIVS